MIKSTIQTFIFFILFNCLSNRTYSQNNFSSDLKLLKHSNFNNYKYNLRKPKFLITKSKIVFIKYNPVSLLLGSMMYIYQKVISPQIMAECIYRPSCSEFSKQLIINFGLLKGVFLTTDRLMRCNQFTIQDINSSNISNKDSKINESTDIYKYR
ncbi:MAG: membrane protein insertion efficiency factor YidD [Bacteroidales bacterium]|jgi:putative membrane protein insertion efficiency factor